MGAGVFERILNPNWLRAIIKSRNVLFRTLSLSLPPLHLSISLSGILFSETCQLVGYVRGPRSHNYCVRVCVCASACREGCRAGAGVCIYYHHHELSCRYAARLAVSVDHRVILELSCRLKDLTQSVG